MRSSTILLPMLLGIFQQASTETVRCSSLTGDVKCCDDKKVKAMKCAFDLSLKDSPECKCLPQKIDDFAGEPVVNFCTWETFRSQTTNKGTTIPCASYNEKECTMTSDGDTACLHYPPPASLFSSSPNKYCRLKKTPTEDLPDESIYDVYFTCWLYDCGNRLEKTEKTLNAGKVPVWCYPPVLPGNKRKYCPAYINDTTTNFYQSPPFVPLASVTQTSGTNGTTTADVVKEADCALLPICHHDGTVNKATHMIPWVNGKADATACERLCNMKGRNDGKEQIGDKMEPCRMLPSCLNGSSTVPDPKKNRFQVPMCRPWCSDEESLRKLNNESVCNPTPMCAMVDGKPQILAPYSLENPFGSERCLEKKDCSGEQKEETTLLENRQRRRVLFGHHCTAVPEPVPEAKPSNKTGGLSFIMPMVIAVLLCAFRV